jgi:hypothetical protein
MHLEPDAGLTQHALVVVVAAEGPADNLTSLMWTATQERRSSADAQASTAPCRCNRAYAVHAMPRMLPPVLLLVGDVITAIDATLDLPAGTARRVAKSRYRPRQPHDVKPHPRCAYKG